MTTELLQAPASAIALFATTKAERAQFADNVIASIEEGRVDPLNLHVHIKCMEEIIKSTTGSERYKEVITEAAQKHGKAFQLHNASFQVKEAGTKYDWSNCNDTKLGELLAKQSEIDADVKARQDFLKHAPMGGVVITDEDSGETTTVYPPSKSSTTTVAVTLK